MDNKKIGIIILVSAILIISVTLFAKWKEDMIIEQIVEEEGSCFLNDGTCLHADRDMTLYVLIWIISAALVALGAYLVFFERSQKEIVSALEKQKHIKVNEEKFNILLKGLTSEEQKVIKAVKEQDGITQQTLRLRTDLHKSKLSIVLDGLEKKGLIARKDKGKTKQVFLKFRL